MYYQKKSDNYSIIIMEKFDCSLKDLLKKMSLKETFIVVAFKIIEAIKTRGWSIDCLAWRPVTVSREADGKVSDVETEVFVFEITP